MDDAARRPDAFKKSHLELRRVKTGVQALTSASGTYVACSLSFDACSPYSSVPPSSEDSPAAWDDMHSLLHLERNSALVFAD